MNIHLVSAREIIDSRGNPTVMAEVELEDGTLAEASVPSGASTGSAEAFELRDGIETRYLGRGVLSAVSHVNEIIGPALIGVDAANQTELDRILCDLDGTKNKSNLGANAILAVSLAVSRASAVSNGLELFEYISQLYHGEKQEKYKLPVPMFNVLNGGAHAQNNIDIQETMVVPNGIKTFEERLRAGVEIFQTLKTMLSNAGYATGLGDEGGFAPNFDSNEKILEWAEKARDKAGYSEKQVNFSLDIAATEFFDLKTKKYNLKADHKSFTSAEMIKYIDRLSKKYNLYSVEDGLSENDENWLTLTKKIKPTITIGDDLFTTNPEKIETGAAGKIAGGVIIKPNQIGTLSETLEAIRAAKAGGLKVIVSHRSGETEDSFIADLAVGVGADLIKSGDTARSERLSKYNRLLKIEDIILENY